MMLKPGCGRRILIKRKGVFLSGAAAGNYVLFAGGTTPTSDGEAVVDIYNTPNTTWTTSPVVGTKRSRDVSHPQLENLLRRRCWY
ncbi:MAG: hypothetical protein IPM82_32315 [Saprospiraceae bacterium]|nr:hypothetical protein [Saprospiraceae bacterium]